MRNFLGRSGAAIGVVGLLAAGLVGVAAPAQAENQTRNVYVCNSGGTAGLGSQSITANPGDTIKAAEFLQCRQKGKQADCGG